MAISSMSHLRFTIMESDDRYQICINSESMGTGYKEKEGEREREWSNTKFGNAVTQSYNEQKGKHGNSE